MKVKDLCKILKKYNPEVEVGIEININGQCYWKQFQSTQTNIDHSVLILSDIKEE